MHPEHGSRATWRPAWPRIAAGRTAWPLLGLPSWVEAQPLGGVAAAVLPGSWVLAASVALAALVAGAAGALWADRSRRVLREQLRAVRARASSLEPLLDVWLWQTDSAHRVVATRPPAAATGADWAARSGDPLRLWECFEGADAAQLRGRLDASAPLDDWPVTLTLPGGARRTGLLRGRAWVDAQGQFAGYHGTFLETRAAPETAAVPAPSLAAASTEPAARAPVPQRATGAEDDRDAFSFTVSHDLRAPIRVVEGFTKIVKEDYGGLLDRVGNDHLDRVLGAAARMNNMIDALLALSKLSSQPLARQPVNLSQLAQFVGDDLRRQSPERHVTLTIAPDLQVHGDPTLLRVAIENLLGNAWKYTARSGQAEVSFARDQNQADGFVVSDNGAGFDMRFAERLFGVFQRLHSANDFPGTGIGLASVKRIVRRHGGEIWAEAEVNRGARFHFSVPRAAEPPPG